MKKGISKIYGFMLENIGRKDINISAKELKYICDCIYLYIISHKKDIKVMIIEEKCKER